VIDFKALLNTDISVMLHGLDRLWRWWGRELRGALPFLSRSDRLPKSLLVAELCNEELIFREYRRSTAFPIPRYGASKKMLTDAVFALPESAVLVRDIHYPPLPTSDLRRIATLEFDLLTPFRSDDVIFDIEVQPDGRPVALGLVRKRTLDGILNRLWSFGAEPRAISLVDRMDGTPRFDFLPWTGKRRPLFGFHATYWWMIVAVLIAANIALLIAKDVYSLSSLREVVQLQRSSVHLASALRRRVTLEEEKRATLVQSLKRPTPLAVWNAVTNALPDDAWVEHLEWNGKAVRLVGMAPQNFDVLKAVRATPTVRGLPDPVPVGNKKSIETKPPHPSVLVTSPTTSSPPQPPVAKKRFETTIILKERS
jgi:hypothetical protein